MLQKVLLALTLILIINTISTSVLAPTPPPGYYLQTNKQADKETKVYFTKKVKQIATIKGIPPKFLLSIWQEESRSKLWVKEGTSGELSPFQIMPSTAKHYNCKSSWSYNRLHGALCSAKIISRLNCKSYLHKAAKYNTGRCNRINQYARNVYGRMRR